MPVTFLSRNEEILAAGANTDVTDRFSNDNKRSVDFVLSCKILDALGLEQQKKRQIFESNLIKEGLELEHELNENIHFTKIHAPNDVLSRYAEHLKIKLPLKKIPGQERLPQIRTHRKYLLFLRPPGAPKSLHEQTFPTQEEHIYATFLRSYEKLFNTELPNFFESSTRNFIINFILERQYFVEKNEGTPENLGIDKLIEDGIYEEAYALHDASDNDLLLKEWGSVHKWKNLQPLDKIKEYFGPRVAIYFAWLGFYTHMLIPLSVIGLICSIYGAFLLYCDDPVSAEICQQQNATKMCPLCDRDCAFWELESTCVAAKINHMLDNGLTVIYALSMSLWAVLYLEFWKRYCAGLVHHWGLSGFSPLLEHPNPKYLAKLRLNKQFADAMAANNVIEPDVSFWKFRFWCLLKSYTVLLTFICISLIVIGSLIVYRMSRNASNSIFNKTHPVAYKILVYPITAAIIDIIAISLLDYLYSPLAVYITNIEYCRTQNEYDESLSIKNFIFKFVNYYTTLFYIAFFKGKFVGYPADYNLIFGYRQEECSTAGCAMELCMQLCAIMFGRQMNRKIAEVSKLYLQKFNRTSKPVIAVQGQLDMHKQWITDFKLVPWRSTTLFEEYNEMVLQYGFVTLCGVAFPLAPLLALINNIFEIRFDARKMLIHYQRPVAQRANSIGVWYKFMHIITRLTVLSNAIIIAFTTSFIPKFVYKYTTGDDELKGYLNFSLAYFDVKDFQVKPNAIGQNNENITQCRYVDIRNPPWHKQPYERPYIYWEILAARLIFVILFQNVITLLQVVISWSIPDVPYKLRKRIEREEFLIRNHIILYERMQASGGKEERRPTI